MAPIEGVYMKRRAIPLKSREMQARIGNCRLAPLNQRRERFSAPHMIFCELSNIHTENRAEVPASEDA